MSILAINALSTKVALVLQVPRLSGSHPKTYLASAQNPADSCPSAPPFSKPNQLTQRLRLQFGTSVSHGIDGGPNRKKRGDLRAAGGG